jgi:hypothetical protein
MWWFVEFGGISLKVWNDWIVAAAKKTHQVNGLTWLIDIDPDEQHKFTKDSSSNSGEVCTGMLLVRVRRYVQSNPYS